MLDYRDYPELSAEFVARHPMDDPRFEPWLEAWYGRPSEEPEDGTIAYQDGETATLFTARAWSLGAELTRRFPLESVGRRVWEQNGDVDWYASLREGGRVVWDATHELYASVFEPNADHSLGHLSEGEGRFQGAVYMFWDSACWYAGASSATDRQRKAFLGICERALESSKASVQESALHGLGHATPSMPEAKRAIERFLKDGKPRRKELRRYAAAALENEIN